MPKTDTSTSTTTAKSTPQPRQRQQHATKHATNRTRGSGGVPDEPDAATRAKAATEQDQARAKQPATAPAIRHVPGRPGPKTAEERTAAQDAFLASFAVAGNITASCRVAQIARSSLYEWLEHDEAFSIRYHQAREEAVDVLEAAAFERAVKGVTRYVVSAGRIVRDETTGRPLLEREYSDTLLLNLLRAHSPKFKQSSRVELTGADGGPVAVEVNDARAQLLERINRLAERTAPPDAPAASRGHRQDAGARS